MDQVITEVRTVIRSMELMEMADDEPVKIDGARKWSAAHTAAQQFIRGVQFAFLRHQIAKAKKARSSSKASQQTARSTCINSK
jgi:hypothetical protein